MFEAQWPLPPFGYPGTHTAKAWQAEIKNSQLCLFGRLTGKVGHAVRKHGGEDLLQKGCAHLGDPGFCITSLELLHVY